MVLKILHGSYGEDITWLMNVLGHKRFLKIYFLKEELVLSDIVDNDNFQFFSIKIGISIYVFHILHVIKKLYSFVKGLIL
jgi:hypothetical protein